MAEFAPNDNTFSLFKNDYKKKNDKRPDYKGKGKVNGKKVDVAAWIRETTDGKKYFSGVISEPYKKPEETTDPLNDEENNETDIPF